MSLVCLGCLCEVSTGCNITIGCNNMVCGPFSITKYYWEDVGKPPPMGESSSDDDGLLFLQKLGYLLEIIFIYLYVYYT